jgi:hypothetical protein
VAKIVLNPGFEAEVIRRIVRPHVDRLKEDVAEGARRRAPDARVWITREDERVRISHEDAHGQTIPANLRFKLKAVVYVHKGRGPHGKAVNPAGGWEFIPGRVDLARRPRDRALPVHQRANCRCQAVTLAGVFARSIHAGPTIVEGLRVTAQVETRFNRAAESEFGTAEDAPARFMRGALDEASRRYRR